jgi:hypothetical protein
MVERTIGVLVFAGTTCVVIVAAAGGSRFLQRPLGGVFLGLWSLWWLVIALGRRRGAPPPYNHSQRGIMALGIVALLALFALAPWECGHFDGPIPRRVRRGLSGVPEQDPAAHTLALLISHHI